MNQIVDRLDIVLTKTCLCKFSKSHFGSMQFMCSKDDKVVIVQGRLIGLPTINSSELLLKLQEWTKPGPSINVDGTKFFIQEQCIIDNINTTNCVLAHTRLPNKLAVGVGGGVAAAILLIFSTVCVPFCIKLKGACKKTKWDSSSYYLHQLLIITISFHTCINAE